MNGLLAMPTSDALVSTPNPVPCAPAGITLPAALYAAVIAAPMPRPSSVDAAHHHATTLPLTPTIADAGRGDRGAAARSPCGSEIVVSSRPQK